MSFAERKPCTEWPFVWTSGGCSLIGINRGYTPIDPCMPVCLSSHCDFARGPGGLQKKKKNKWEVEEEKILIAEWEKFD